MAYNLWQCAAPECKATALGVGSAIGLRAIGWWFVAGGDILCPAHRPDPTEERSAEVSHCDAKGLCAWCAAEREAARLQLAIARETDASWMPYFEKMAARWQS